MKAKIIIEVTTDIEDMGDLEGAVLRKWDEWLDEKDLRKKKVYISSVGVDSTDHEDF